MESIDLVRDQEIKPSQCRVSAYLNLNITKQSQQMIKLLSRHQEDVEYNPTKPSVQKILIPIPDIKISNAFDMIYFGHPYTLIGLLNDSEWIPPSYESITEQLLPFHLHVPRPENMDAKLIPQISNLYFVQPEDFLIQYKSNIDKDIVEDSWKALYHLENENLSEYDKTSLENQIQIFLDGSVLRFPSVDWKLNSIEDLFSLHTLACAINTKIYLILAKQGNQSALYSIAIGPKIPKYKIFVICQSPSTFYIAMPQNQRKLIKPQVKSKNNNSNLVNTFETIDHNYVIFYNYPENFSKEKFDEVMVNAKESVNVDQPTIEYNITEDDDIKILNISCHLPILNKDNNNLLLSTLKSLSDEDFEFITVERPKKQPAITDMFCKNVYRIVGSGDSMFILTRSVEQRPINDYSTINSISKLEFMYENVLQSYRVKTHENLTDMDVFRLYSSHFPKSYRDTFQLDIPRNSIPLFLETKGSSTLSECANSPYAELLCLRSILNFAVSKTQRYCPKCQSLIPPADESDPLNILYPMIELKSKNVSFVCKKCIRKNRKNTTFVRNFEKFKFNKKVIEKKDETLFFKMLKTVDGNIEWLKQHPIGYLTQMLPLIENAFITLQKIVAAHQQMNPLGTEGDITAMFGIRDTSEADIQFTIQTEYSEQPISPQLFADYLKVQDDIKYSASPYSMVQTNAKIIDQLYFSALLMATHHDMFMKQPFKELPKYSLTLSKKSEFSITIEYKGNISDKLKISKGRYLLYPIVDASHLSLSPITSISTHLLIQSMYQYDDLHFIIVCTSQKSDHDKYLKTYLYYIEMGHVVLSSIEPIYEFKTEIVIHDSVYCSETKQLGIAFEELNGYMVGLFKLNEPKEPVYEVHAKGLKILSIKFLLFDGESYLSYLYEDDSRHIFVPYEVPEEENVGIEVENQDITTLVCSTSHMLGLTPDGHYYQLYPADDENEEEEEEEEDNKEEENKTKEMPFIVEKFDIAGNDTPIFSSTKDHIPGIVVIPSPKIPFRESEDRINVAFYPQNPSMMSDVVFEGEIDKSLVTRKRYFYQFGMDNLIDEEFDIENENRSLSNLHLTMAELIPALIAYQSNNSYFCVRNDLSHYRATCQNVFLPSAVNSYYSRTYQSLSLHHVEKVVLEHSLPVIIVGFISNSDDNKVAQVVDTVYGTRFSSITVPGVWVSVRVINNYTHVLIYFKSDDENAKQLQLLSIYRGANIILVFTSKLISTLNFLLEFQNSSKNKRNVFNEVDKKAPYVIIELLLPYISDKWNTEAIVTYKNEKKIVGIIKQIPYRANWNTPNIDDILDEQVDSDDFISTWSGIFNAECFDGKRKPYEPEVGIRLVKQIISTYLTIAEFKDLSPLTVIHHCNINFV